MRRGQVEGEGEIFWSLVRGSASKLTYSISVRLARTYLAYLNSEFQ
jgi:hypothetical protein